MLYFGRMRKEGVIVMNRKVIIALVAVLVISVGAIIYVLCSDNEPNLPVVNNGEQNQGEVKNPDNFDDEDENKGTVPNVITKSGLIKSIGKDYVTINGGNGKEVKIYITDETKIYGPDGSEKKFEELVVGKDITVDINGDEYAETDTKFEAMIIYVSGK